MPIEKLVLELAAEEQMEELESLGLRKVNFCFDSYPTLGSIHYPL